MKHFINIYSQTNYDSTINTRNVFEFIKGRNDIVQYVPAKKSHQWGAKLFVLAESDTGYNAAMQLYAGY